MTKFTIQSSFGDGNIQALNTLNELSQLNLDGLNTNEVNFDLSDYNENNPFNNLAIALSIRQFVLSHPDYKFTLTPKDNDGYLCHIGFYDLLGVDHGKKLGEAQSSSNYVPITPIIFGPDFYQTIETKAQELSNTLNFDKDLSEFLSYAFIETIRNVYEHAEAKKAYISAQKWPSMNLVEIAIADTGCGIAHALGKRIKNKSELQLMHLAALPGISAKSNWTFLDRDDSWKNSGYGLFVLRRLANIYGGSFLLCSGNTALRQEHGEKDSKYSTFYHGTVLAIRIRTNMNINFQRVREQVIREGEIKAKQISNAIRKASKSSGGKYNGQA